MGRAMIVAALLLPMAACGRGDDGKAAVSISTDDKGGTTTTTTKTTSISSSSDGGVSVSSDAGNGRVKIDAPGFKLDVDVPHSIISAADFQLDGAKLYPGSKMRGMDVRAGEREGDARVNIGFVSPADPATVRGWMVKEFAAKGHPLRGDGMALAGTTEDGKPFTVALSPGDAGQTRGQIAIQGDHTGDWSSK